MAKNYQFQANQLTPGQVILVQGNLEFGRLTRRLEGEALTKSDQVRVQNGMRAIGKPHTSATVVNAKVMAKDKANPTLEETYVAERCYQSKKDPNGPMKYSVQSKGEILPTIAIPDGNGKFVQDTSGRELASGVNVTLVLRVYEVKTEDNRGLSLDQVLVNEEVRYYAPKNNVVGDELAARGVVFATPPQTVSVKDANPTGDAAPVEGEEHGTVVSNEGFALPGPGVPTQQAQAPAAAPAQPEESLEAKIARLEAEKAALQTQQPTVGSAVGAPASPANPWASDDQTSGITYQS